MVGMTEEPEIVDLDQCPVKPALIVGGAIAFVLTLFQMSVYLCCMPLILAGFTATTAFIFKYQVRLELKYGMKIAMMACLWGFGASTVVYDILWAGFDYQFGLDVYLEVLNRFSELASGDAKEQLIEGIEQLREQSFSIVSIFPQIMMVLIGSGIGGAIGGALATAFFKKGRLVQ